MSQQIIKATIMSVNFFSDILPWKPKLFLNLTSLEFPTIRVEIEDTISNLSRMFELSQNNFQFKDFKDLIGKKCLLSEEQKECHFVALLHFDAEVL